MGAMPIYGKKPLKKSFFQEPVLFWFCFTSRSTIFQSFLDGFLGLTSTKQLGWSVLIKDTTRAPSEDRTHNALPIELWVLPSESILMNFGMKHQRSKPIIFCSNYDPGLTWPILRHGQILQLMLLYRKRWHWWISWKLLHPVALNSVYIF